MWRESMIKLTPYMSASSLSHFCIWTCHLALLWNFKLILYRTSTWSIRAAPLSQDAVATSARGSFHASLWSAAQFPPRLKIKITKMSTKQWGFDFPSSKMFKTMEVEGAQQMQKQHVDSKPTKLRQQTAKSGNRAVKSWPLAMMPRRLDKAFNVLIHCNTRDVEYPP